MFDDDDLRQAAGEKSFSRGRTCPDAVDDLEIGREEIGATVYGGEAYETVLALDDDGVTGECSCPHSQVGFFWKHLVAVGLTVLGLDRRGL